MRPEDWIRIIDQAAELGVSAVQFIGGEPTLHPHLRGFVDHARGVGLEVEIFSNLVRVTPELWGCFEQRGVRLACSYYSDDPVEHAKVTRRRGSHARTRANIVEALRRSIPLRVGVIDLADDQRSEAAIAELKSLGVEHVGYDRLRHVGRGGGTSAGEVGQLCGHCASGVLAIGPDGAVWPCVFSRWLPVGNVLTDDLRTVMGGPRIADVRGDLRAAFGAPPPCLPNMCKPHCGPFCGPACEPQCWPTGTGPCGPKGGCMPNYEAEPIVAARSTGEV
jgi:MoaA/NifB/PqqE/SkfB family radical SAM enzyme